MSVYASSDPAGLNHNGYYGIAAASYAGDASAVVLDQAPGVLADPVAALDGQGTDTAGLLGWSLAYDYNWNARDSLAPSIGALE